MPVAFAKWIGFSMMILLSHNLRAQSNLKGILVDDDKQPLAGAVMEWKNHSAHAITDSIGHFEISRKEGDSVLVINYVGFKTLEYTIHPNVAEAYITLSENTSLQQVEVKAKRSDVYTPLSSIGNKELISLRELRKAPCCNLSESFETSAVIDANYTNAALGTREIEMLGLRGIYSQIMLDSRATLYRKRDSELETAKVRLATEQAPAPLFVLEQDVVLPQHAHGFQGALSHRRVERRVELVDQGHRLPVQPQHAAARGSGADAGEQFVLFGVHGLLGQWAK
jgi:hypothetical protein